MRKALHIFLLLLGVAVAAGCHGPRRIPRGTMEDIYYDLFLTDARIGENPELRRQADTMLVYEAVFNRYGYNTDDYLYSLRYYLKDPERFAKTVHSVSDRFQKDIAAIDADIAHEEWVHRFMNVERPSLDTLLAVFLADTTWWGDYRIERDSSLHGGWIRIVAPGADSTAAAADSLAAPRDSLAAPVDSVALDPEQEEPVEEDIEQAAEEISMEER